MTTRGSQISFPSHPEGFFLLQLKSSPLLCNFFNFANDPKMKFWCEQDPWLAHWTDLWEKKYPQKCDVLLWWQGNIVEGCATLLNNPEEERYFLVSNRGSCSIVFFVKNSSQLKNLVKTLSGKLCSDGQWIWTDHCWNCVLIWTETRIGLKEKVLHTWKWENVWSLANLEVPSQNLFPAIFYKWRHQSLWHHKMTVCRQRRHHVVVKKAINWTLRQYYEA